MLGRGLRLYGLDRFAWRLATKTVLNMNKQVDTRPRSRCDRDNILRHVAFPPFLDSYRLQIITKRSIFAGEMY